MKRMTNFYFDPHSCLTVLSFTFEEIVKCVYNLIFIPTKLESIITFEDLHSM